MPKPLEIIVAVDQALGIGKNGQIPWHLPADLARFKTITSKVSDLENINAVIMGRKTWDSIPLRFRPLPNRLNIVLSRSQPAISGATRAVDLSHAVAIAEDNDQVEKIFVIGGSAVYQEALPLAQTLHITWVHTLDPACDAFFPKLPDCFQCQETSEICHTDSGLPFIFSTFVRS